MSAFTTNRAAANGINGMFGAFVAAMSNWNDARVTRKALHKLSDRELDDIGLVRGDIEMISRSN